MGNREKRQVANVCVVNGVKGAELMTFLEGIGFILPQELDKLSTASIP